MPGHRRIAPTSVATGLTLTAILCALSGLVLFPYRSVVAARQAEPIDVSVFREMAWRPIGPLRAGRVTSAAGIPSIPNLFYVAVSGGGLWKTTDYGQSWHPAFDGQPSGAVSAVAIAASRPDAIYAGTGTDGATGPAVAGDGLFASLDAGATWRRTALDARGAVARIDVHPAEPDRIIAAVVETPADPDAAAGLFRSIDGGRSFTRVLTSDARGGQIDLARHPGDPDLVYALADEGFFQSEDDGATWRRIDATLPASGSGATEQVALAVSAARPDRVFALVDVNGSLELHRSEDRGSAWTRVRVTPRPARGAARVGLTVDPSDADVVFLIDGAVRRSEDGGVTFAEWPNTDVPDGHDRLWISPSRTGVMLLAGRAGAAITVNGGTSWSARHAQSSADMASVVSDTAFPYRVCGIPREGPVLCVSSHPDPREADASRQLPTTPRSHVAPDPNEPDVLFLGGPSRYDRRTGQLTPLATSAAQVVADSTARDVDAPPTPILFGPDGKTLYFAAEKLWRSADAGLNWTSVGPDSDGRAGATGATPAPITAVSISTLAPRIIWLGTGDGRVLVTRDGGTIWTAATPADLPADARIAHVSASHFDTNSAYVVAAADRARTPLVWRTRDGGQSWAAITQGLPAGRLNVVREDAFRRGLLFAGADRGVFVSFDDGESWQPLRLNLPAAPIRDLTIKDDDVVAATGGRGFWILDDISVLRQVTADVLRAPAFLFRPAVAWRMRAGAGGGPPSVSPAADAGAFHYLVGPETTGTVTLEVIATTTGEVLRRFSSDAPAGSPDWLDPSPGLHRRVWDLRYRAIAPADPDAGPDADAGLDADTLPVPGLRVPPGAYQVRLTADERPLRQAISIRLDPRVRTSAADLAAHFELAKAVDDKRREIAAARDAEGRLPPARAAAAATLDALARALDRFDGRPSAALVAAVAQATR